MSSSIASFILLPGTAGKRYTVVSRSYEVNSAAAGVSLIACKRDQPMRILVTNRRLDVRAGAERSVRQHARALQRLGHSVIAFSSDRQRQPRLLENDVVPVATDLAALPVVPDLIHAQHHLDTMTALFLLTDTPMFVQCDTSWWPSIPVHPRIHAYLVPTSEQADELSRIVHASAAIHVWRQPLDLERLGSVRTPPVVPRRSLFFNRRRSGDEALVSAIERVCERRGITLAFPDVSFNREVDAADALFGSYDLVFTSAGAATEAIACGCAVVLTERGALAEMVLPESLTRLGADGFRVAPSSTTPADDEIDRAVDRYSAAHIAEVTHRVRAAAHASRAFDDLLAIYDGVMARHRLAARDWSAELRATARYLAAIARAIADLNYELEGQWARPDRDLTFYDLRTRLALVEQRLRSR